MATLVYKGIEYPLKIDTSLYSIPIGTILSYPHSICPKGFLPFDGREYRTDKYPELYEIIKDLPEYRSENEGYFKLPNLTGRVLQQSDVTGEYIEAGIPNVIGKLGAGMVISNGYVGKTGAFRDSYYNGVEDGNRGSSRQKNGVHVFNASHGETRLDGTLKTNDEPRVYGKSDTVQPPAFTVTYIIKAYLESDIINTIINDNHTDDSTIWSSSKIKSELSKINKGIIYSTTEQIIGKWINGENLYQRVVTVSPINIISDEWISLIPRTEEHLITKIVGLSENGSCINFTEWECGDDEILVRTSIGSDKMIDTIILEYTKGNADLTDGEYSFEVANSILE